MLTKKQLVERLEDIPDDALIGGFLTKSGTTYGVYWEEDGHFALKSNIMCGAPQLHMTSDFNLNKLRI